MVNRRCKENDKQVVENNIVDMSPRFYLFSFCFSLLIKYNLLVSIINDEQLYCVQI